MSDFLASLVVRSLGEAAPVRDTEIRPRPVAAFESEVIGNALQPDTEITIAEQVYETRPGHPRLPPRDAPPEPAARPPGAAETLTAEEQAPNAAPRRAQRKQTEAPAPTAANARTTPTDAPLEAEAPAPDAAPLRPAQALEPGRQSRTTAPEIPIDVRVEPQDLPSEVNPAPRSELSSRETDSERPARRQPRAEPTLERMFRQLVLAPRPNPALAPPPQPLGEPAARPAQATGPRRPNQPAMDPIDEMPRRRPTVFTGPADSVLRVNPPSEVADNHPAAKLTHAHEGRAIPRLSPVPEPPRLPDQPRETTVRINIGRIEVRTGAATAPDSAPRPKRPEAPLMSLDDYLSQRAEEN